ncbi:uncharacterized protein LOC110709564 [Chenopodium quinoa]|uniref:uncharacterized protein LOC110709564 n=1 Tax=Chenopodium quinoa TaxID=63459 RepID=UPI000B77B052|nr:uncharacterized protein LOC110709564 [Chenopodium quinoa]
MLLTRTSVSHINEVKKALDEAFTIKDLGELKYFLGIEISRNTKGTFLSQKKYIRDIISDVGMEDCIPVAAPLPTGLKLSTEVGELLKTPDTYKILLGRLLYLQITKPDLSYVVQHLSQFIHAPRSPHLRVALHVVKYLKGTLNIGLWYSVDSDLTVKAYSDEDWNGCQFSSRSLSAYTVFLGSNLVSWKTKKQRLVSKSSAEQSMEASKQLAQNPMYHEKSKHLKRDMHYVREQVEDGFLQTAHVSSDKQLADVLTNPLASTQHWSLISKFGLLDQCPT